MALDNRHENKIRMYEIHDKFYEIYDNIGKLNEITIEEWDNICAIENEFFELYIWFEHYKCTDSDLKRANELCEWLVDKYNQNVCYKPN